MGRSVEHDAPARFAYVSVICTYDPRPNFHGRLGNAQEKEACNPRGVGLALLRCVRFTEQEENEEEEDGDADGGGGHRGAEGTPPLPLALPLDTNSQGCPKRCRSHLAARLKAAFLATVKCSRRFSTGRCFPYARNAIVERAVALKNIHYRIFSFEYYIVIYVYCTDLFSSSLLQSALNKRCNLMVKNTFSFFF